MAGIIDTNILLYAVNADAEEHRIATDFLRRAGRSADQWYLSEGILYEFLRVSTHPKVFEKPLSWKAAMQFLRPFLASPNFRILSAEDGHWTLLEKVLGGLIHPAGNLFFDIRTFVLMYEHGIGKIYTMDNDFLQFPGIKVINPLLTKG